MATIVVDTGGTGDYTSLANAEADEFGNTGSLDFVTDNYQVDVEVKASGGAADTTYVGMQAYICNASYYIKIWCSQNHGGKWNTSVYRLSRTATSTNQKALDTKANYLQLIGLQIELITSTYSSNCALWTNSSYVTYQFYDKLIVRVDSSGGGASIYVILCNSYGEGSIVQNSIFYGIGTAYSSNSLIYFPIQNSVWYWTLKNCTIYRNSGTTDAIKQGNSGSQYCRLYNCVVYHGGSGLCFDSSYGVFAGDYNCSSDGSAPGTHVLTSKGLDDLDFENTTIDGSSEDFHIQITSCLIGEGDNLSAQFTDDIDGNTRSSWDIGADEYSSGIISGSTCWGHDTGVTEDNTRDFSGNWTGTGTISLSGDSEIITLNPGEYMESEVIQISGQIQVNLNSYAPEDASGPAATVEYKTGSDAGSLGSYQTYSAPFTSDGYVQIKVSR